MGKPAAHLNSNHTCPAKRGKTPHVGGPICSGSPNVMVGGLPHARVGDKLICNAPPDTIKAGSASVFVNGKAAARMSDPTVHGGVIVSGNGTVLIGDKTFSKAAGPKTSGNIVAMARRELSRVKICQKDGNPKICEETDCPCR